MDTTQFPSELARGSRVVETRRSGPVRPLCVDDLNQVADLYQRVFGTAIQVSLESLKRILFEPPWRDDSLPSLAYEDESGRIIGCLGVMPRQMKFRGRPVRAAIAHHFMVDPSRRGTRAGVELARRFLRGSQDLSLAGGNESSRRIWEYLGGSVCLLYSFCWTRALRPAQYALTLNDRGLSAAAALSLKLVCQAVDATLQAVAFEIQPPAALADELDAVTMLAFLSAFANGRSLLPVYDLPSITGMIEILDEKRHRGTLHKVAVRTESGRPLGWYLYYLTATGVAEVLQIGGNEEKMPEVLNHLFYHAWQRGAVAASGPMDSRLCRTLSENHCEFHGPDSWMLIHSSDQQIVNTIHAGDAFLSRLEGEWWIAC